MTKKKEKFLWKGQLTFIILSLLWFCVAIYGFFSYNWTGYFLTLSPTEFVAQISALLCPMVIFYLIGNFIDRNQIYTTEIKATRQYLEELIHPSELGEKHMQDLNNSLKEQIHLFRASFLDVSKQTNQVREDLTNWIEDLNKIITHMNEQTKNMAKYVQQLEETSSTANEQSAEAGRNLASQADILMRVTDETEKRLVDTSKHLKTQTEEIAQNVNAVEQAEKNMIQSLDKSADWVKLLTQSTSQIEKAMKTTDVMQGFLADTDKVLMNFKEIGTTLDLRLKSLKQHNLEPEKRDKFPISNFSAKEFTQRMQQILDKLQGLSVEMMSVFEIKNEEELWNQYYMGDKAIFMRHIQTILNQSKKQKILSLALTDAHFQENVEKYMTTFEDLTRGLENSPWLGVLVGSDPGRLYMVLADVFKGEKNASKIS